jgi:5-methyltetrahydrofolate--homocysteine methyltransferase
VTTTGRGFLNRLSSGEVLVADGATGTNHQEAGLGLGVPPEEWVFDAPEKVKALHRAFVAAGSDIILTDTFGGTSIRLRESRFGTRVRELNRTAAELARQVAAERAGVLVAGSMGPTGQLMEPYGALTQHDVRSAFAEQAEALAEGGVDLLLLETFFDLQEARAAIEGIKEVSDEPIVVTFSFDQGTRTMMGLTPSQVVQALAPLGLAAIGANCGKSLDDMVKVAGEMARVKEAQPLWIKPNAGLPRMVGDHGVYDTTPETMGEYTRRFLESGAQIVGGCCGTSPEHLRAIAGAVPGKATAPRAPVG